MPEDIKTPKGHNPYQEKHPRLKIDYQYYANMLEDTDLTDEQKREFITTLWSIIVEYITLGIEVIPIETLEAIEEVDDEILQDTTGDKYEEDIEPQIPNVINFEPSQPKNNSKKHHLIDDNGVYDFDSKGGGYAQ